MVDGEFLRETDQKGTSRKPSRDVSLTFEPDDDLRRDTVSALRNKIVRTSPQDAGAITADVFKLFDQALRPYSLSTNDLADTTSVYLIELWDAVNGQDTSFTARQARTLSDQFAAAYAVTARTEPRLSDQETLQRQSDTFLLQAYLIASLAETYRQPGADRGERAAFREAMRGLGREVFGIDLTKATIDERGLTPGEAIGALDTAVREEREARAVADPKAEAERTIDAALGSPCGRTPADALERKVLRLFESKEACDGFDPAQYERFLADTPSDQHYAINFAAYATGKPLFPAAQAKIMDGMIE